MCGECETVGFLISDERVRNRGEIVVEENLIWGYVVLWVSCLVVVGVNGD